ncbi:hypothetical protein ACWER6_10535 [Streptomyces sp. NPDC004009]
MYENGAKRFGRERSRCATARIYEVAIPESSRIRVARLSEEHGARIVAVMREARTKIEGALSPASGAPDRR